MAEAPASAERAFAGEGDPCEPSSSPNPSNTANLSKIQDNHDYKSIMSISKDKFENFEKNSHGIINKRNTVQGEGARSRHPSQSSVRSNKSTCSDTANSIVSRDNLMDVATGMDNDLGISSRKRTADDQSKAEYVAKKILPSKVRKITAISMKCNNEASNERGNAGNNTINSNKANGVRNIDHLISTNTRCRIEPCLLYTYIQKTMIIKKLTIHYILAN